VASIIVCNPFADGFSGIIVTSVKLSHIPDGEPLRERGLEVPVQQLGLTEPWLGSVTLGYELSRLHGKLLGKFEAEGELRLQCSRCLEGFDASAKAAFMVEFEPVPEEKNERSGEDPDDPGPNVAYFSGDIIEFGEEVRQELELQVPFAPLCRADCKGLCPVCGVNRNETACDCQEKAKTGPFQGLDKLFQQNKEN
jgi:uncharacterized protein